MPHDGRDERESQSPPLGILVEPNTFADVPAGAKKEPARDRQRALSANTVDAAVSRATKECRLRRAEYERSAFRAEFLHLSSNCVSS